MGCSEPSSLRLPSAMPAPASHSPGAGRARRETAAQPPVGPETRAHPPSGMCTFQVYLSRRNETTAKSAVAAAEKLKNCFSAIYRCYTLRSEAVLKRPRKRQEVRIPDK